MSDVQGELVLAIAAYERAHREGRRLAVEYEDARRCVSFIEARQHVAFDAMQAAERRLLELARHGRTLGAIEKA